MGCKIGAKTIFALLALSALAGCDQRNAFDKALPFEDVNFAKSYVARLQALDFAGAEEKIDVKLKDGQLRQTLEKVAAEFPSTTPIDVQPVGAQTFTSTDANKVTVIRTSVTLQYQFPEKWVLAMVNTEKRGGETTVTGVHVRPLPDSLAHINRFTFQGKGFSQYTILLLSILSFLVIVVALVLIVKTPIPKRKWLWIVFVLFGVGQLTVNWTDGSWHADRLSFLLLGFGFSWAGPYAPVLVSTTVPLGAILFLVRRPKWLAAVKSNEG